MKHYVGLLFALVTITATLWGHVIDETEGAVIMSVIMGVISYALFIVCPLVNDRQ